IYTGNTNPNQSNDMAVVLKAKWIDNCTASPNCSTVADATYHGNVRITTLDGVKVLASDGGDNGTSYVSFSALENINVVDGFTLEIKARWTDFLYWSRVFTMGNGANADNILVANDGNSDRMCFSLRNDSTATDTYLVGNITLNVTNVWKFILVKNATANYTIYGYRDGVLLGSQNYTREVVRNIASYQNVWIGRSQWTSSDKDFAGYVYYVKMTLADGTKVVDVDFSKA
ncbi:MAG: hypothetical protein Q4E70_03790, partial [Candidatus Saccharibacteria bacterium]|nr:hypothetical protein [Candidatus Saccharibacteria bacterium]